MYECNLSLKIFLILWNRFIQFLIIRTLLLKLSNFWRWFVTILGPSYSKVPLDTWLFSLVHPLNYSALVETHNPCTICHQPALLAAAMHISLQILHPALSLSFSAVILHVVLVPPLHCHKQTAFQNWALLKGQSLTYCKYYGWHNLNKFLYLFFHRLYVLSWSTHVTVISLHMYGGRTVPLCMFTSVDQYTGIMNREFCRLWIYIGRGVEFLKFCVASKQVTKTTFM